MRVSVADMVATFREFNRYRSVVCFADDVFEALYLAKRIDYSGDHVKLPKVRPGQYEFVLEDGFEGTVYIRKPGIVEMFPGVGRERLFDQCPLPILAVQKAEVVKEGLVHETFLLLKGEAVGNSGSNWCFLMHKHRLSGELEAYAPEHGGLVRWAKDNLWPRKKGAA